MNELVPPSQPVQALVQRYGTDPTPARVVASLSKKGLRASKTIVKDYVTWPLHEVESDEGMEHVFRSFGYGLACAAAALVMWTCSLPGWWTILPFMAWFAGVPVLRVLKYFAAKPVHALGRMYEEEKKLLEKYDRDDDLPSP